MASEHCPKTHRARRKNSSHCLICTVECGSKKTPVYHQKSPMKPGSCVRSVCGTNLPSSDALTLHEKVDSEGDSVHKGRYENPAYQCNLCSVETKSPRTLVFHFMNAHPDQNATWTDPKVKKRKSTSATKALFFDENQNEIIPVPVPKRSKSERPKMELETVECPFCQLSFGESRLKGHLMTEHPYQRNLLCTHCATVFKDQQELMTHITEHTQGRLPEKCSFCDSLLVSSMALKAHLRLHRSKRPFKCTVCWKEFSTKTGVTAHFYSHSRVDILDTSATTSIAKSPGRQVVCTPVLSDDEVDVIN